MQVEPVEDRADNICQRQDTSRGGDGRIRHRLECTTLARHFRAERCRYSLKKGNAGKTVFLIKVPLSPAGAFFTLRQTYPAARLLAPSAILKPYAANPCELMRPDKTIGVGG